MDTTSPSATEALALHRRRRSRIDTPEPRRLRRLLEGTWITGADLTDIASEDFGLEYDGESWVVSWLWKLFDVSAFVFQTGMLCVGVVIWIAMVVLAALWNFVRWALSCQGCLVLFPVTLGGCLFAALNLLEDYGSSSEAYIDLKQGNEGKQQNAVTGDKTLFFGLIARRSALDVVAESGHTSMIKVLLDGGANPGVGRTLGPWGVLGGSAPLAEAAKHGHRATIDMLLEAGANEYDGWRFGPFGGVLRTTTPIIDAASNGHLACVNALIEARAQVDTGWQIGPGGVVGSGTPLFSASKRGHFDVVKALVAAGASPDAGWAFGPMGVFWGLSPLLGAIRNGDLATAEALLDAGAEPNPRGEGEELRKASTLGHTAIVQALLRARAVPDERGRALQGAVRNGHNDVAAILMQAAKERRQASASSA